MIKINNLHKQFKGKKILNGINLEIGDGKIFGIIGKSGAGKSTLLNCINRLEDFDSGSILVDEVNIETLSELGLRELRKNMGMIFQNYSLIKRRSVYDNIALPLICWGTNKKETDFKVREIAEQVGIADKLKKYPSQLSGGEKQRVAIARALTMNPKYLLCDECTSALDPGNTLSVLELLYNLRNKYKITIVIVTHEMDVIKYICDDVCIIRNGNVVETQKVENLFTENSPYLDELIGKEGISGNGKYCYNNKSSVKILFKDKEYSNLIWKITHGVPREFEITDMQTIDRISGNYSSFRVISDNEIIDNIVNKINEINTDGKIRYRRSGISDV